MTQGAITLPAKPARLDPGRVVRLVFGGLGLLAGLAFLAGAVALTVALETHRDGSGYFTTHTHHYQTSAYALSTQSLNLSGVAGTLAAGLGTLRITATSDEHAKPLFAGIARTRDVDTYLAGVEHDELRDISFEHFKIDYRRSGAGTPATLPAKAGFWREQATGTSPLTITWPLENGRWSAVVMNADGSRGVGIDAQLKARFPYLWWLVAGLSVASGLSLLGGGALAYTGVRNRTAVAEEAGR